MSSTVVIEGAEWSFSASVVAGGRGESGAEVISSSLLCKVVRARGMDMHLGHSQKTFTSLR